jgi:hypothetical protein
MKHELKREAKFKVVNNNYRYIFFSQISYMINRLQACVLYMIFRCAVEVLSCRSMYRNASTYFSGEFNLSKLSKGQKNTSATLIYRAFTEIYYI